LAFDRPFCKGRIVQFAAGLLAFDRPFCEERIVQFTAGSQPLVRELVCLATRGE
jgi:hypothetical protein